MRVAICETQLKPRLLRTISSKGDGSTYTTIPSTLWNDPVCDCRGFQFRSTCRHVDDVEEARCHWVDKWTAMPNDHKCPHCGSLAVEFELDPEL